MRAAYGPVEAAYDDFFFVQLSDNHWGFEGAPNPKRLPLPWDPAQP